MSVDTTPPIVSVAYGAHKRSVPESSFANNNPVLDSDVKDCPCCGASGNLTLILVPPIVAIVVSVPQLNVVFGFETVLHCGTPLASLVKILFFPPLFAVYKIYPLV